MTDSPHGPVHQPGHPALEQQHQTPTIPTSRSRPTLLLRPEQRAPIGDDVKDLRPLTRAALPGAP
jgi:hypothetical protein